MVTRHQALEAGFSVSAIGRAVERGDWQCLRRGIFVVDPAADPIMSRVMGGILRATDETWASHRTAAHLWGLDTPVPLRPELTSTANLRGAEANVRRVSVMPLEDRRTRRGIPLTSPERTLIDIAAVVPIPKAEALVIEALRKELTSVPRLAGRVGALTAPGRSGPARIRRILEGWERSSPPESVLESRLLGLMRRARLPMPCSQWEVRQGGRVVARLDLAYPEEKIAIEADGYRWHGDIDRWRADLARRNTLTRLGWLVLHFTWHDVHRRPRDVADTIRAARAERRLWSQRPGIRDATTNETAT